MIVNWTIQRAFPWASIVLFLEQINIPCTVFLSEKDMLVPSDRIEQYFKARQVPVCDFDTVDISHFESEDLVNCTIFRGDGHGAWTERQNATVPMITAAVEALCRRVETKQ
jgi:hypothetical protein